MHGSQENFGHFEQFLQYGGQTYSVCCPLWQYFSIFGVLQRARNFSFSLEIKNLFWLKLVNCNSGQTSLDDLVIYSTFLPAKCQITPNAESRWQPQNRKGESRLASVGVILPSTWVDEVVSQTSVSLHRMSENLGKWLLLISSDELKHTSPLGEHSLSTSMCKKMWLRFICGFFFYVLLGGICT